MPIAKVQLPDGRIARLEVEDGTTPEQVEAFVAANLSSFATEANVPETPPTSPTTQETPGVDSVDEFIGTLRNIGQVYPVVETAASALTSLPAMAAGGLTALGSLATGSGLQRAQERSEAVQQALTYQPRTQEGQRFAETVAYPQQVAKELVEAGVDPIAEAGFPKTAATVATAVEAAPLLFGAKTPMTSVAKSTGVGTVNAAKKLLPKSKTQKVAQLAKENATDITNMMDTAIRPSVTKKKTAQAVKKYDQRAVSAVEDIVNNKENLRLFKEGEEVAMLPESVADFQTAIAQTKNDLFKQYDNLIQQAGDRLRIGTDDIIAALDDAANNPAFKTVSPETVAHINKRRKAFENVKFSPAEAQETVALLNKSLESFYNSPGIETHGAAFIDSLIANRLRKNLNTKIQQVTGKDYADLKRRYGALKAIEDDVGRAANRIRNSATNQKLPDFTEVIAGHQLVKGVMGLDPATLSAGGFLGGVAKYRKMLRDPNTKVKSTFANVEKRKAQQRDYFLQEEMKRAKRQGRL